MRRRALHTRATPGVRGRKPSAARESTSALTWSELGKPFLVDYKPEHSATGKHYMASLFIPGQRAEVLVNGVRGVGKPIPRDMYGAKSTTAFLAFSETWVRG